MNIPNHVAIIMDGNGRWAKKRLMPRNYGHAKGAKAVERICEDAFNLGIKYLTVYAFSTENWNRPEKEVDAIMKLLSDYLSDCVERSNKNNMKVRIIGDINRLNNDMIVKINNLIEATKNNTGLNFTIALNYGGRDEIIRAVKKAASACINKDIEIDEIDEAMFSSFLDTADIPDPDLLIRTSGEERLSNYLLWQLAYTEFYFTDVLWPDFNKKELEKAITKYNRKERRFGGVKEE